MKPLFKIPVFIVILFILSCAPSAYKWAVTDKNENILVGKIDRSQLNDTQKFPGSKKIMRAITALQALISSISLPSKTGLPSLFLAEPGARIPGTHYRFFIVCSMKPVSLQMP